jgi:hypothetical protein
LRQHEAGGNHYDIMTISNVGSATSTPPAASQNTFTQSFNDFKSIGTSIQSGDLTTAQNALTAFQSDLQNTTGKNPVSQLFSNNSKLGDDLTSLQTALKSNNAAGAQSAYKTLVQDMQGAMKTQAPQRHHHHHHVESGSESSTAATTLSSSTTDSTTGSTSVGSALDVQA